MGEALARVHESVIRLGERLSGMRPQWFVALVTAVFIVKSTFNWSGSWFAESVAAFPQPAGPSSSSYLPMLIHALSQPRESVALLSLSAASLVVAVILFVKFLADGPGLPPARRIVLILALSWPAVTAVLPWVSNGTAFNPMFTLIAVFARRTWLALLGVLGALATHPEQSMISFVLLALVSFAPEFRPLRKRAVMAAAISVPIVVAVTAWFQLAGATPRADQSAVMEISILYSLRYGVLGAYSWWGVWWVVVLAALVLSRPRTRALIALSAVAVPAFFATITDNYTRVFVGTAMATGLALAWLTLRGDGNAAERSPSNLRTSAALGYWMVLFILLPNLNLMMPGDAPAHPGDYWVGLAHNLGILPYP